MKHIIAIVTVALALGAMPARAQTTINPTSTVTGAYIDGVKQPPVKIGVVNLETIAAEASEGKAATAKIQALVASKRALDTENIAKLKTLQDAKAPAAQIQALTVANERYRQDAQAEIDALQNQLQADFQKKLLPVLSALAQEKGLQILLSFKDSGIIWGDKSIDLTKDAVTKMDATK